MKGEHQERVRRDVSEIDILIVDDDRPIRNLVRQIVQRIGVSAREAGDGQEAIEGIEKKRPDVVILDLMMPRVSGWQVLQWMRERKMLAHVPVIVLTAAGARKTNDLVEYTIRSIIDKPFEISELSERIREIIDEVR